MSETEIVNCEIKQEPAQFSISINGVEFLGFRLESTWEGFAKYVDTGGRAVIVVQEFDPMADVIQRAFCTTESARPLTLKIVTMSPSLYSTYFDRKAKLERGSEPTASVSQS